MKYNMHLPMNIIVTTNQGGEQEEVWMIESDVEETRSISTGRSDFD